jgi:ribonuclease P/MRP protein subunit POP5
VKHLPKHIQPRWRYLAVGVETWPDTTVERDAFQRALWYSAQNLLGDPGSARLDLSVLRFRAVGGDSEAVVRTRRGELDRARAVVACVDRVAGDPVGLRVRGASGTVRACEEKYMGAGREYSEERDVAFEDADRPAVVRGERADVRVESGFVGATALETE